MTTYTLCKSVIERGTYGTYDEMMFKLDVFFIAKRITDKEYNELIAILKEKEGITE